MRVLVIDVGGNNIKVKIQDCEQIRKHRSGPDLTPARMVHAVHVITDGWPYDVVSLGYPGPVKQGSIVKEPVNLGPGWVDFDFHEAFQKPTKIVNDAAMQALGSYEGGRMLFLGLGTGLGSTLIADGTLSPMELGHLPYKKRRTFEQYVGELGLQRLGRKKWIRAVFDVVRRLQDALLPDYVVLGGGNVKKLNELPPNCKLGGNEHAFLGGVRLWQDPSTFRTPAPLLSNGQPLQMTEIPSNNAPSE
jgi:polyphosphate glucokinase